MRGKIAKDLRELALQICDGNDDFRKTYLYLKKMYKNNPTKFNKLYKV